MQSETADFAPGAATWGTIDETYYDSRLFVP